MRRALWIVILLLLSTVVFIGESDGEVVSSTFIGGDQFDDIRAQIVLVDGVIVAGSTDSSDLPATSGAAQSSIGGSSDGFVCELARDLSAYQWCTYLGGTGLDDITAIAVSGGDIIVGGWTTGNFPNTTGVADDNFSGEEGFVARITSDGSTISWASYYGGDNDDRIMDLGVRSDGTITFGGHTDSTDLPGAQNSHGGDFDAFMATISADGTAVSWATYIGGTGPDFGSAVYMDNSQPYICGTTSSSGIATSGVHDETLDGVDDAFVTRLFVDGTVAWTTYLGGPNDDACDAIYVNNPGAVFVAGSSQDGFPVTVGAEDTTFGGARDAFVAELDGFGWTLEWASYIGGDGNDYASEIVELATGDILVVGETYSTNMTTSFTAFSDNLSGSSDGFISVVNYQGDLLRYRSYLGGSGDDRIADFTEDGTSVVLSGVTYSSDFPITGFVADPAPDLSFYDSFVTELDIGIDATAPGVPSSILEDGGDMEWINSSFELSWSGASDPESGIAAYLIEEIQNGWNLTVPGNVTSITISDFNRTYNFNYQYTITPLNGWGRWSSFGVTSNGLRYDDGVPAAPVFDEINSQGPDVFWTSPITIEWMQSNAPSGITDYEVDRMMGSQWTNIATTNETMLTIENHTEGLADYRVRAVSGSRIWSNYSETYTVDKRTDTTPPDIWGLTPEPDSVINETGSSVLRAYFNDNESGHNIFSLEVRANGELLQPSFAVDHFTILILPTEGLHEIEMQISDYAGNTAYANWSFTAQDEVVDDNPVATGFAIAQLALYGLIIGGIIVVTVVGFMARVYFSTKKPAVGGGFVGSQGGAFPQPQQQGGYGPPGHDQNSPGYTGGSDQYNQNW